MPDCYICGTWISKPKLGSDNKIEPCDKCLEIIYETNIEDDIISGEDEFEIISDLQIELGHAGWGRHYHLPGEGFEPDGV